MFCKFCGEKVDEKSLFCSKCGANLKEQPASASIVEESAATAKSGRDSFKNKILLFIESNSILLSLCITILTFFVPLQITNQKVILGIDLILFFKIKSWWGDLSILALIVGIALFVLAIFFVIYTLVILKKEGFSSRNKCLNKIIIFNLVLSILYFVFGLVTLFLCDSSWKPWTLSFIPLLLQSPIFLVYIKKIRNNNCNEFYSSNKNRLSKLFIISISTLLCFVFVFCGYIDCSNNNGSTSSWSFYTVYSECSCSYPWAEVGTDYLSIDTNPYDYDSDSYYSTTYASKALSAIRLINTKLDLPSYLYDEMVETRAIYGRQSYSGTKVNVSWDYHPDSGLEVRYTKK